METIPDAPHEPAREYPSPPPLTPVQKPTGLRLGVALIVSAIFYAVTFGVTIPVAILFSIKKMPLDATTLVIISQAAAWPASMLAGLLIARSTWNSSFALRGFSWRLLPGLLIGCFGLSFVLNRLATTVPMPKFVETFFRSLSEGDPLMTFIAMCLIAPIAEEMFFRGWMLRGFMAHYSARKSIWMTAIIFALFHLNPWQALVALPLGLLFGWFVLRTGSLVPGMIGHFVVNFTNTKLMLPVATLFGHSAESLKEATHLPWEMVGVGAALSAFGIGLFLREVRPAQLPCQD